MKYAYKLSFIILLLLALVLSVSSFFTVSNNFSVSLNASVEQNLSQHYLERYALEAELAFRIERFEYTDSRTIRETARTIATHTNTNRRWQALYKQDYSIFYSNIPFHISTDYIKTLIASNQSGYLLANQDDSPIMVLASKIQNVDTNLWFVTCYDISDIFVERQRQMDATLRVNLLALGIAALVAGTASFFFTRPLKKLAKTSGQIAAGNYAARTNIKTNDEIGELGQNFNQMAEAVEKQVESLQLSVQQRQDFVAAFSHEIKTPMTAIIGYSDLLRFQKTDAETRRKALHFIYREATRLETLSQKLLALMGLSDEKIELEPTPLNLIFRDMMQSVYPVTQQTGVSVKVLAANDISVMASRDLAANLLRNLVLNAIQAAPKDNTVWVGWKPDEGGISIFVQDSGKGIAEEEIKRITEPFYRVDKARARQQGGSGIGLALCQKIAEFYGTALSFQSEVEVGTTVRFLLLDGGSRLAGQPEA